MSECKRCGVMGDGTLCEQCNAETTGACSCGEPERHEKGSIAGCWAPLPEGTVIDAAAFRLALKAKYPGPPQNELGVVVPGPAVAEAVPAELAAAWGVGYVFRTGGSAGLKCDAPGRFEFELPEAPRYTLESYAAIRETIELIVAQMTLGRGRVVCDLVDNGGRMVWEVSIAGAKESLAMTYMGPESLRQALGAWLDGEGRLALCEGRVRP